MDVEKIIKAHHKLSDEKRVLIHLQMISSAVTQKIAAALKPFGISLQQFNVLRILRGQKGEVMNQNEIRSRMVHKMSNTTRLVDKLIEKGMAKREVCKDNRRKVEIKITRPGEEVLTKIDPVMLKTEQGLLASFSEKEIELLNNLLDKINTGDE